MIREGVAEALSFVEPGRPVRVVGCLQIHPKFGRELRITELHVADNLHAYVQGTPNMFCWRDRATRRFQFSAEFVYVGVAWHP